MTTHSKLFSYKTLKAKYLALLITYVGGGVTFSYITTNHIHVR